MSTDMHTVSVGKPIALLRNENLICEDQVPVTKMMKSALLSPKTKKRVSWKEAHTTPSGSPLSYGEKPKQGCAILDSSHQGDYNCDLRRDGDNDSDSIDSLRDLNILQRTPQRHRERTSCDERDSFHTSSVPNFVCFFDESSTRLLSTIESLSLFNETTKFRTERTHSSPPPLVENPIFQEDDSVGSKGVLYASFGNVTTLCR
jgi:hypothetical protein